jgi:hypothetical protein
VGCFPRSLARTARISCRRALTQRIGYGIFAIESSSLRCSYACHLAINTNQKCTITGFVLVCSESLEWHNPFCADQSWFGHVRSCMLCFLDPLSSRGALMRKLTVSNPAFVPRHTFLMQNGKFACSLEFEVSPGTLCLRSIRPAIDTMSNASDTTILSLVMSEQFCTAAQASCQHVSYSLLSRSSKR